MLVVGDGLEAKALTHSLSLLTEVEQICPAALRKWSTALDAAREAVIILGLDEDGGEVWRLLALIRLKRRWGGRVLLALRAGQKRHFNQCIFIRRQDQKYPAHGFLLKPVQVGSLLHAASGLSSFRTHGFSAYLDLIAASSGFDAALTVWRELQTASRGARQQEEFGRTLGRSLLNLEDSVRECMMKHAEENLLRRWVNGKSAARQHWMNILRNIITRME